MRIRHLNCATLNTLFGAALIGTAGPFARARGVTHCLLVETDDGLLLVDTGLGTRDCLNPTYFMRWMIAVGGFPCDPAETAVQQVQRLGYRPEDVKHIALTHFHFDHAGGLPDFPQAKVHIYREEYQAVTQPRDMYERYPYRAEHWSHGPDWVVHDLRGDRWFDLDCTPPVDLGSIEFRFAPLTGHTRGHSGVALRTLDGWLLHCGDAYTFHGEVDPDHHTPPPYQHLTRPLLNLNRAMRPIGEHAPHLRRLARQHGDEAQLLCSHDPYDLEKFLVQPSPGSDEEGQ